MKENKVVRIWQKSQNPHFSSTECHFRSKKHPQWVAIAQRKADGSLAHDVPQLFHRLTLSSKAITLEAKS
jgi:hypothetical protein